jgi:hypothetical protein
MRRSVAAVVPVMQGGDEKRETELVLEGANMEVYIFI